jgi:hypothetical protein
VVRVGFVVESTGATISALLNPTSLVVSRTAGVVPERTPSGSFARRAAPDAPLLFTGGGRTELQLQLLFDAPLHAALNGKLDQRDSTEEPDVRDLTAPFFVLGENPVESQTLPIVRFIWGKSWNVRGVVAAVSEKLEHFTQSGVPQRSWMTMRFLRVLEAANPQPAPLSSVALDTSDASRERGKDHVVSGAGTAADASSGERLDRLASRYYGDPSLWRVLATYNNIEDPARIPAGTTLRIPPASLAR